MGCNNPLRRMCYRKWLRRTRVDSLYLYSLRLFQFVLAFLFVCFVLILMITFYSTVCYSILLCFQASNVTSIDLLTSWDNMTSILPEQNDVQETDLYSK